MSRHCLFIEIFSKENKNLHIVESRSKMHSKILPFIKTHLVHYDLNHLLLFSLTRSTKATSCTLVQYGKENTWKTPWFFSKWRIMIIQSLKKELKYKRKEPYSSKVKYFVESDVVEYSNDWNLMVSLLLGQHTDRQSYTAKVELECGRFLCDAGVMLWIFNVPDRPNVEVFSANMFHY